MINNISPALNVRWGKLVLAALAVAGFAFLFAPEPSNAASVSYCRTYARQIATRDVPTDVTTDQQRRFRRIFSESYANCRSSRTSSTVGQRALLAPEAAAPAPTTKCDFSRYAEPRHCDD